MPDRFPSDVGGPDAGEQSRLGRYLGTVLGHIKLIIACVVVALVAAGAYVKLAPRTYTATAQVLINPATSQNTVLFSLPVLHSSGDPTQDVLTASALLTTPQIANATANALHLHESASEVLGHITAVPLDQSNIISIQATSSSPEQAQRLANAFATQAVATRTATLHKAIALILPGLSAQVQRLPAAQQSGAGTLGDELTQLQQIQHTNDPTISVSSQAELPVSPTSPKTTLSVAAGLLIGLLIGLGAAFAFDAVDPRLQREEQLVERFRGVPVLARIPQSGVSREAGPLTPLSLPPIAVDQYRLLRAVLMARRPAPQAYLVTGSAPSEGKTTSAINLAAVLAQAGANVILIDTDLRRPSVANALGIESGPWTEDVLSGKVPLTRALSQVRLGSLSLLVLPAQGNPSFRAERVSVAAARKLVEDAKRVADFVVVDSPPLTAVVEGLPFAQVVDDVLVTARVGHSRLSNITKLWELLAHQRVEPFGFILVGVREHDGIGAYGYYSEPGAERPASDARELNGDPVGSSRLPSGQASSA